MNSHPVIYLCAPGRDTSAVSQRVREMLEARRCEVIFHPPAPTTRLLTRGYCRTQRRPILAKCDALLQLVGHDSGPMLQRDEDHESPCSLAVWEGLEAAHFHKIVSRVVVADGLLLAPLPDAKAPPVEQLRYQAQYRRRLQKAPLISSDSQLQAFLEDWIESLRPAEIKAPEPVPDSTRGTVTVLSSEAVCPGEIPPSALAPQPTSFFEPTAAPIPESESFREKPAEPSADEVPPGAEAVQAEVNRGELIAAAPDVEVITPTVTENPTPACQPETSVAQMVLTVPAEDLITEPMPGARPAPDGLDLAPPTESPQAKHECTTPPLEAPAQPELAPDPQPILDGPPAAHAESSLLPDPWETTITPASPEFAPLLAPLAQPGVPEVEGPRQELDATAPTDANKTSKPRIHHRRAAVYLKRSRSAAPMKVEFAFVTPRARAQVQPKGKCLDISSCKQEPRETPPPKTAEESAAVHPLQAPSDFEAHLLWPAEQAMPEEAKDAVACASHHYAEHLLWPSTLPDRAEEIHDDTSEETRTSAEGAHAIPSRVYVQLAMVCGAFAVAALLASVSLWQTISHRRALAPIEDSRLAQADQIPTVSATPAPVLDTTDPAPALITSGASASHGPITTAPIAPTPAAEPVSPGQRQQEVEQGLADVIQTLRQRPEGGSNNLTGAHAKLFLAIQLDLDQTLRQLSNEKEGGNPKLFQVSRDLATTRLLAAEFPAARNCLLDLRDLAKQVHGDNHAETLMTDYLLAMTDLMQGLNDPNEALIEKAESTLRSGLTRLKLSARVSNRGRDTFEAALQCCENARTGRSAAPALAQWVWQRFPMTATESEALLTSLQWGLQTQN